jgi:hypothetical protein
MCWTDARIGARMLVPVRVRRSHPAKRHDSSVPVLVDNHARLEQNPPVAAAPVLEGLAV